MTEILQKYGLLDPPPGEEEEEEGILERYGLAEGAPDPNLILEKYGLSGPDEPAPVGTEPVTDPRFGTPGTIVGKALKRGVLNTGQNAIGAARGLTPLDSALRMSERGRGGLERRDAILDTASERLEVPQSLRPSREYSFPEEVVSSAAEAVPLMGATIGAMASGQPGVAGAMMFSAGYGNAYGRALEKEGASEAQRQAGAVASGMIELVGEAIPLGRLARILKGPLQGPKRMLMDTLTQVMTEGGTEMGQEVFQRLTDLLTFARDEDWGPEDWRQAFIAGSAGGLLGMLTGGLAGGVRSGLEMMDQNVPSGMETELNAPLPIGPQDGPPMGEPTIGSQEFSGLQGYQSPPSSLQIIKPDILGTQVLGRERRIKLDAEEKAAKEERKIGNWEAAMTYVVDPGYRVKQGVRRAKKQAGPEGLADNENPYLILEEMPWYASMIQGEKLEMEQRVFSPAKNADVNKDEFSEWLFFRRIAYGDRQDLKNPLNVTKDGATLRMYDIEQEWGPDKTAVIRRAAESIHDIRLNRVIRRRIADSGLATAEELEHMELNPNWIRFFVQKHMADVASYKKGAPSYLKHQVGTEAAAGNVLLEMMLGDAILQKGALVNKGKLATVELLRNHPAAGRILEDVEAGDPVEDGMAELYYRDDGVAKIAHVDDFYVQALEREFDPAESAVLDFLNTFMKTPMREVLVERSPPFAVFNAFKDPIRNYLAMRGGPIRDAVDLTSMMIETMPDTFRSSIQSVFGAGTQPQIALDALANNEMPPVGTGIFRSDTLRPEEQISDWYQDLGYAMPAKAKNVHASNKLTLKISEAMQAGRDAGMAKAAKKAGKALNYWPFLSRFPSEFSERWSILTGHLYVNRHPEIFGSEEAKGHEVRSNFGTPNYYQKTPRSALFDNFALFGTVKVQAARSVKEIYQRNPKMFIQKTIMLTSLPVAASFAAGMGLMGPDVRRFFGLIPEHDKRNYFNIPIGFVGSEGFEGVVNPEGENLRAMYVRIPRDHFQQAIGNSLWVALSAARDRDPQKLYQGLSRVFLENMPWMDPSPIAEAGVAALATATGVNPPFGRYGRPIYDRDSFVAGIDIPEQYARWAWSNAGLTLLYNFNDERAARTHIERLQKLPFGIGPLLKRFVKISDAGLREEIYDRYLGELSQEDSRRGYLRKKSIIRYVRDGDTDFGALWDEHVRLKVSYDETDTLRESIRRLRNGEEDVWMEAEEGLSRRERAGLYDLRRVIENK